MLLDTLICCCAYVRSTVKRRNRVQSPREGAIDWISLFTGFWSVEQGRSGTFSSL
jgi:hypothetical protein